MKKALSIGLAFLFCVALFAGVPMRAQADGDRFLEINEANFPDAAFRSWILSNLTYEVDAEGNPYMTEAQVAAVTAIDCADCGIKTLVGVERFTAIKELVCYDNQLTALDVSKNTALTSLYCSSNHLRTLNLSKNKALTNFYGEGQTVLNQKGLNANGVYTYDMTKIMTKKQAKLVRFPDSAITMDSAGVVTLPDGPDSFVYRYNASADPDDGDIELPEIPASSGFVPKDGDSETFMMDVEVYLTYETLPAFDGTVEWNASDVQYRGTTPYVIANGKAQTPRFTVKAADGSVIDPSHYTFEYRENVNAGTAYVVVTFKDLYSGTAQGWFKIYLSATTYTAVENRDNGVYLEWKAVSGAAGYVIYRRAWNLQSAGWTSFVRWNNTTDLNWTDTKVYAGTRYQYGIKAYFAQRVDPVSGATIGGNVGDNYNLGQVGPLKTTVRITTRTLNSVKGGSKRLTVKWSASKNFTGYEVQIATDANFTKNVKTVKIADPKTAETTIKSLKAKTTYYARVRSYHIFEGTTYYGGWSNVKSAKTK